MTDMRDLATGKRVYHGHDTIPRLPIGPSARGDFAAAQAAGPLCTVCGYASIRWIGDTGEEMLEVSAGPDRQNVHVHPSCLKTDYATFGFRLAVALGILPEEV